MVQLLKARPHLQIANARLFYVYYSCSFLVNLHSKEEGFVSYPLLIVPVCAWRTYFVKKKISFWQQWLSALVLFCPVC